MSSQSSASTTLLWGMSSTASPLLDKCICETPLPQFRLRGNVFAKFLFHNSALGVMLWCCSQFQNSTRVDIMSSQESASATLLWGYVYLKFYFHNSALGDIMSPQSSTSATLLCCYVFPKFHFHNSALGEIYFQNSAWAILP